MGKGALALTLATVAVAVVLTWSYAQDEAPPLAQPATAPLGRTEGFSLMGAAPSPLRSLGPALSRSVADVEQALFVDGSLREAALDGDWSVDAAGRLQPSLALRRRFDQLLTTLGEVNLDELTAWLRDRTLRDVGPHASAEILAVWDRYIALLERPHASAARWGDPHSWAQALAERQRARRDILGPVWAEAFFRDEEEALRRRLEANTPPNTPASSRDLSEAPSPLLHPDPQFSAEELHRRRIEQFGLEAAERLRAEDEAQAQWQARLDQARQQLQALRQAAHLSEPQRRDAIEAWIASHFDATEQLRVRALLGL